MTNKLAVLLVALACASACQTADPTATLPGIPQQAFTETFQGTIAVGATNVHTFVLGQGGGPIGITVTALAPANIQVLISLGHVAGNACDGLLGNQALSVGQAATTAPEPPGQYCLSAADASNTGAPVAYTLTVVHP